MKFSRNFATFSKLFKQINDTSSSIYIGKKSSNNLSVGLVGLANVGKSTFFQSLTKSKLGNPANYPFATIEPEKSTIIVESETLNHYNQIFKSNKKINTNLIIWDIAGLTKNCNLGEGMGNKFLNNIRQVDGIIQIVRGFENDDITHIEKTIDPIRDLIIVQDELILKDVEFIENEIEQLQKLNKKMKFNKVKSLDYELNMNLMDKVIDLLYNGKKIINCESEFNEDEIKIINKLNLLTAKPTIYCLNVSEEDYKNQENKYYQNVLEWVNENSNNKDKLLMFSGEYETKINELKGDELEVYQNGTETILNQLIKEMRSLLKLISFYTCGETESKQWTILKNSTILEAAGLIHTDLKNTFINSIVYKWEDLSKLKQFDENMLKSMGKQYRQGKKYIIEDGDVIIIKAGKGKAR
ncbi:unnamed protein product [Candida verbasci]|uniref:OBG-type G domain-containing protein n=1 Tax=Candida verbasci TaxID=1227364 RepID=A0A9W4U0D1_9ASCO|nr:unnamed protein product [Candida verbasci]